MTIFLVRHAHAGKRSEWKGDDVVRPVSARGVAQSEAIRDLLADRSVRRILSSPYARCVQTMEPLSAGLGVAIEPDDRFAEGARLRPALEAFLALDAVNGVACSHGDLIPELLRALVAIGMEVDGPLLDQKGSTWTIETNGGHPVRGTYTPPAA